jgi:asparagine synthase (glutamine-hydrolysing)
MEMANILALTDPDPVRRNACIRKARQQIAPIPGLVTDVAEAGPFAAVWAASERAPVAVQSTGDVVIVLWGEAFRDRRPATARDVGDGWLPALAGGGIRTFDGYHAAVAWREGQGWVAGTDVLGMFPLYHGAAGDVRMVASSPELFHCHPSFDSGLDDDGLLDALLLTWPLRDRTLMKGVRRLRAQTLLVQREEAEPEARAYFALPGTEAGSDASVEDHCRVLDEAIEASIAQHPVDAETGLLLSGGSDSRLLAGYLGRLGVPARSLTLGRRTDDDARCAAAVARTLGFTHSLVELGPETYPGSALLHARWEHLQTGFSTVHVWAAIDALRELPRRFLTGYVLDGFVAGGSRGGRIIPWDEAFDRLNALGIRAAQLSRLLCDSDAEDRVRVAVDCFRDRFEGTTGPPAQRALRFQIANSQRCTIGTVPWRLTFGSWPVLPFLDRQLLEVISRIPAARRADRGMQHELIRTRFPRLARLPLDRNSRDTTPLMPTPWSRIPPAIRRARFRAWRRGWLGRPIETRYFHRMYDFNGPGWRAIRRLAEPFRVRLADRFDMDELNRFLPPPEISVPFENPLEHSAGHKQLVGLMLWAGQHVN